MVISTEMAPVETLEDRFRRLALENPLRICEVKVGKGISPEAELKVLMKEISFLSSKESLENVRDLLSEAVKVYSQTDTKEEFNDDAFQEKITNALTVLKSVAEIPLRKEDPSTVSTVNGDHCQSRDPIFEKIIFPNLPQIYSYFSSGVFQYCEKSLKRKGLSVPSSGGGDCNPQTTSNSAGYARHQLLGLLQKGVRTLIVFLKRGLGSKTEEIQALYDSLISLITDNEIDVGLDIRCNAGLALAYLIAYKSQTKEDMVKWLESLFKERETLKCPKLRAVMEKDDNVIGMAVGILCFLNFEDEGESISTLLFVMAQRILDMDHGTKEALNLGCARVLEMLLDKISHPKTPLPIATTLIPLFNSVEFFAFSYIPGHIDAVKNCCRNMLGSLTRVFTRLESTQLVDDLLTKLLNQSPHVKFLGLSSVCQNSSMSLRILNLERETQEKLLCAPRTCKNAANECYICLMSYAFLTTPTVSDWELQWVTPLFKTQPLPLIADNEPNWPQKKVILSTIFSSNKIVTHLQVLKQPLMACIIKKMNDQQNSSEEATLLAAEAIKTASEYGLKVDLNDSSLDSTSTFKGLVPRNVLHSWLCNENPQIRLAGFSLLAETKKTSEEICKEDFDCLKLLMKYNLVSQNPAFRQQFMAYFKKLLHRLKDSQALLKRKRQTESLKNYENFFHWLWTFLTEEEGMIPGANFARRCQSLECLFEIVQVFDPATCGASEGNENFKFIHWLFDTYENNKVKALEILVKLRIPAFEDEETCLSLFTQALTLCESVKPPDSVTGRYLVTLLLKKSKTITSWKIFSTIFTKLQETFASISTTSLTKVSGEKPMYGLIRCLRMVLNECDGKDFLDNPEKYQDYFSKLIKLFLQFDDVLFPVLGHAAPEGILEEVGGEEEPSEVVRSITAQMLLVCSWRTMRDICLMMADMTLLLPLEGELINRRLKLNVKQGILSFQQVKEIGDHMLHLMKNLVHRGVFEQVFVGFKIVATRLWGSSNPNLSALPSKWLNEAMDEEHMSSKCITRRSAGLPFIFQALLSAESDNSSFLSDWIQRLFITDESSTNSLVRIHAMNVLRGLFRDANFSKAMMPFVPDGLRIAFRGLKSEDWTVRNAGLMLYGALIRRTFGPKLNLMSAPTFFRRFPQMYDFLLDEMGICLSALTTPVSTPSSPSLPEDPSDFTFHLLLLLSSFAPAGRVEDEHFKLSKFIVELRKCAESRDIEVRKLGARAIIPFLTNPTETSVVIQIIEEMKKKGGRNLCMNHLHGNLVQISTIITFIKKSPGTLLHLIRKSLEGLLTNEFLSRIKCPTIFEALSSVIMAFEDYDDLSLQQMFSRILTTFRQNFPQRERENENRHFIPGLLIADSAIAKGQIRFQFKGNEKKLLASEWLKVADDQAFLEEFLDYLEDGEKIEEIFKNSGLVEALLKSYEKACSSKALQYPGQSVLELKYLNLLTKLSGSFKKDLGKMKSENHIIINRLFQLVSAESYATTEHKKAAFIVLSKLAFESDIILSKERQIQLCNCLVEWTDSSIDDDLRFAAALSIPRIPFTGVVTSSFSVIELSKIWLSTFKLAQDDDSAIRNIVNSKVSNCSKVFCDRKSLERLVTSFFHNFLDKHPLEGLTLLMGIIFRDDFEIKMDEAEDDEENRLFDKSEMNMFCEPFILAKTVEEILQDSSSLRPYFSVNLTPELSSLYELASNTKLFVCSPSLSTVLDLIKMRLKIENENEEQTDDKDLIKIGASFSAVSSSIIVQRGILDRIQSIFNFV